MQSGKKVAGGINLLKIIAMINIIGGHYYSHGAGLRPVGYVNLLVYYSGIFTSGNVGATIFGLITGWFIVDSKFTIKKWICYVGEVIFYSYVSILLAGVLHLETFNLRNIIYYLFPISSSINWYASTFCVAYLFLPFLKRGCISMRNNKNMYDTFILLGVGAFFAIGTLTPVNHIVSVFVWLIFIFIVGDYLRWTMTIKNSKIFLFFERYSCKVLLSILVFSSIVHFIIDRISETYPNVKLLESNLSGRYSIITLLIAIFSLILFSKIKFSNIFINRMSNHTFGIYLLHDNYILYPLIWIAIFKTDYFAGSVVQAFHFFITILLIFISCAIIDIARKCSIERLYIKVVDQIIDRLSEKNIFSQFINMFQE